MYDQYNPAIDLADMFGYVVDDGVYVQVANRIFETCLYNMFLSQEELANSVGRTALKPPLPLPQETLSS